MVIYKLMKNIILIYINTILLCLPCQAKHNYPEKWYQNEFCNGQKEVILPDKTRVDCLTIDYAIEFDFAEKWAECVGQALFYAEKTNKTPACFLIIENPEKDLKHLKRLELLAKKYNIIIFVNNFKKVN